MADKIRVGIIGTGGIARGAHVPGYKELPDVEIAAVCDVAFDRAKALADELGAEAYADHNEMLNRAKLDAVSVCTPNAYHKQPTIDALRAGVHVLCEKPIAKNQVEGAEMVRVAKETGKILTIGLMTRFNPGPQAIRRYFDAGDLGEVYYCRDQYLRRRGIPTWGVFHIKEKSGGGPLIDIGVHILDLAMWLMGNPKPVSVTGATYAKFGRRTDVVGVRGLTEKIASEYDVEDMATAYVRFANGATLTLETSWASEIEQDMQQVELFGDRGGAKLSPLTLYKQENGTLVDLKPTQLGNYGGHKAEIAHFVKCIKGEAEVLVKPEEALDVQKVLDGIYRSAEMGREIAIE
ncbi:MAG TPA: Gfo/Idh/MocA family oxidoreductase [Limnochordia bacterium]|nr:Gfo/Idh/MocA family oxidoreductase [Limnochordia bacterium]